MESLAKKTERFDSPSAMERGAVLNTSDWTGKSGRFIENHFADIDLYDCAFLSINENRDKLVDFLLYSWWGTPRVLNI